MTLGLGSVAGRNTFLLRPHTPRKACCMRPPDGSHFLQLHTHKVSETINKWASRECYSLGGTSALANRVCVCVPGWAASAY